MERRVKERLVGAAVLMAAAIILIPEMLSGPKRKNETASTSTQASTQTSTQTSTQGDGPYKTYTIDLNRSPGAPTTAPVEEQAPPPESELPPDVENVAEESAPDSEAPSENSANSAQASPESANAEPPPAQRVATAPPPTRASPQPQQQAPAARASASTPAVASTPNVPTSSGWAVQLGSFSSRATAERLVKELSGSGHDAFVMPVKSGASTLYRVRIGPFADRAQASEVLANIRKRVANAAVVAHP